MSHVHVMLSDRGRAATTLAEVDATSCLDEAARLVPMLRDGVELKLVEGIEWEWRVRWRDVIPYERAEAERWQRRWTITVSPTARRLARQRADAAVLEEADRA